MLKRCKLSETAENKGISSTTREEDLISQLPDELLYTIISRLKLRDVVTASLLSHRWKYICSNPSMLQFDWDNLFITDANRALWENCEKACILYGESFVRGVNQFLEFHRGTQLSSFTVSCCLGQEWTYDIDRWVRFAISRSAEMLALDLYCDKGCSKNAGDQYGGRIDGKYVLRSEIFGCIKANLKHLRLVGCILGPNFTYQFSCLENLHLAFLPLSQYDLQSLFRCLVKLKVLRLERCSLPMKLFLYLLPRLNKFRAFNLDGLKEIALSNLNIFSLDCLCCPMITFDLSKAPNVKELKYFVNSRGLQQVFTRLPEQLPMLRYLGVLNGADWAEWIPETISTFSLVTKLYLYFFKQSKFGAMKIVSILKAFPCLCKLRLVTYCPEDFDDENRVADEYVPKHLTEVEIGGFYCTPKQMEFAIYLLKNASSLQRLSIKQEVEAFIPKRQSWVDGERQMVDDQLQKFVKDRVLDLVIE